MAKKNLNNERYEQVKTLPKNALTVAQYAEKNNFSTNYVYNLVRQEKNKDFKIVVFNSFNFVVPS